MPTQPSRRDATHDRIVEVASRAIRRNGYAGVGVADVMKQAGLTHGGFYAHFGSRDAMLAEAVMRAGKDSASATASRIADGQALGHSVFRAVVEHYLSDAHLGGTENGCAVAALASEMPRQSKLVADSSATRVQDLIALVARALPAGHGDEVAFMVAGTLVGTLQLARALGDPTEGQAMLAATRKALLEKYDQAPVPGPVG